MAMSRSELHDLDTASKQRRAQIITRLVLALSIIEPALTLPQIFQIWIDRDASGVSVITWGLYIVTASIWLAYGLQLKNKPIIISNALWIVVEASVVLGILLYG